ncbi:MAG: endolytic transglycosylase MltG [Candidatus Methylopumilus sp.]|nr:endolytic transglycosylase MltG [Candidatus Methylopumilus sp.]
MNKLLLYLVLPVILLVGGTAATVYLWVNGPLALPTERVDILVPPGSTPSSIAQLINQAGVPINGQGFVALARLSELDTKIKAGGYQIVRGDSPLTVLRRMALGDVTARQITLVEGWNLRQIRAALSAHPDIKQTLSQVSDADLLKRVNTLGQATTLEGLFFPDTYIFPIGTTDVELLERAARTQQKILDRAWAARAPNSVLKSPYEALILASIIEKETGQAADRARIAGVFSNRLRINMLLQTDPTVIYGMGEGYTGKIRKQDLQTDTPYNTYTRLGLPPSPIASSGRAALAAALNPEKHNYLYFVSKGDGSSAFAVTLPEHNKNVATYILGRKP